MRAWLLTAAGIGASLGVVLLWQIAMIAVLRSLGTALPISSLFKFYVRKEAVLIRPQPEWTESTYILVSGFLLLACPLFAGLLAYDYVEHRYIEHSAYNADSVVGLAVVFVLLVICASGKSASDGKKLRGDSAP